MSRLIIKIVISLLVILTTGNSFASAVDTLNPHSPRFSRDPLKQIQLVHSAQNGAGQKNVQTPTKTPPASPSSPGNSRSTKSEPSDRVEDLNVALARLTANPGLGDLLAKQQHILSTESTPVKSTAASPDLAAAAAKAVKAMGGRTLDQLLPPNVASPAAYSPYSGTASSASPNLAGFLLENNKTGPTIDSLLAAAGANASSPAANSPYRGDTTRLEKFRLPLNSDESAEADAGVPDYYNRDFDYDPLWRMDELATVPNATPSYIEAVLAQLPVTLGLGAIPTTLYVTDLDDEAIVTTPLPNALDTGSYPFAFDLDLQLLAPTIATLDVASLSPGSLLPSTKDVVTIGQAAIDSMPVTLASGAVPSVLDSIMDTRANVASAVPNALSLGADLLGAVDVRIISSSKIVAEAPRALRAGSSLSPALTMDTAIGNAALGSVKSPLASGALPSVLDTKIDTRANIAAANSVLEAGTLPTAQAANIAGSAVTASLPAALDKGYIPSVAIIDRPTTTASLATLKAPLASGALPTVQGAKIDKQANIAAAQPNDLRAGLLPNTPYANMAPGAAVIVASAPSALGVGSVPSVLGEVDSSNASLASLNASSLTSGALPFVSDTNSAPGTAVIVALAPMDLGIGHVQSVQDIAINTQATIVTNVAVLAPGSLPAVPDAKPATHANVVPTQTSILNDGSIPSAVLDAQITIGGASLASLNASSLASGSTPSVSDAIIDTQAVIAPLNASVLAPGSLPVAIEAVTIDPANVAVAQPSFLNAGSVLSAQDANVTATALITGLKIEEQLESPSSHYVDRRKPSCNSKSALLADSIDRSSNDRANNSAAASKINVQKNFTPISHFALHNYFNPISSSLMFRLDSLVKPGAMVGVAAGDEADMVKGLWVKTFGSKSIQKPVGDDFGFTNNQKSFLVGFDAELKEDVLVAGIAYTNTYSETKFKEISNANDKQKTKLHIAALYGQYTFSPEISMEGLLKYGKAFIKTQRNLDNNISFGDTTGDIFRAQLNSSYRKYYNNGFSLVPKIGIVFDNFRVRDFKEIGPGLNLNVSGTKGYKLGANFGIGVKKSIAVKNFNLIPELHFNIDHTLSRSNSAAMIATIENSPRILPTAIYKEPKTTYTIGSAVNVSKTGMIEFNIGYDYSFRRRFHNHSGYASLVLEF